MPATVDLDGGHPAVAAERSPTTRASSWSANQLSMPQWIRQPSLVQARYGPSAGRVVTGPLPRQTPPSRTRGR